jgi:CHRD domain
MPMGAWSKVALAALGCLVIGASALGASQGGAPRSATLLGANEVGLSGDPDGSGTARLRVNVGKRSVCGWFTADHLDTVTGVHVHVGAAGVNGGVVVDFGYPGTNGGLVDGRWHACGTAADGTSPLSKTLVKALVQTPTAYYVNIRTTAYLAGAIRAQLTTPGKGAAKPAKPHTPKPGGPHKKR